MLNWETALELGRAIERLSSQERRMSKLEADHEHLQTEVTEAKTMATRVGLVVLLWLGGLAISMPSEKGGEFLASFLKAWLK